jgi:hypothetical protein
MKKEIRFSAKLDTQEFDRTVDALQRKIKEIYRGSDIGRLAQQNQERLSRAGLGPAPSAQDRARTEQADAKARRENDQFIKQQIRDQEKLAKTINSQVEEMKKLQKLQKDLVKDSDQYKKNQEEISKLEKQTAIDRAQMAAKEVAVSNALDQKTATGTGGFDRLSQAYNKGGFGGAARAGRRMIRQGWGNLDFAGRARVIGSAIGAAGTAAEMYGGYQMLGAETTLNRGAAQAVQNRIFSNLFGQRGYEEKLFAPERQKAVEESKEYIQGKKIKDTAVDVLKVLGVATAATLGASLGPVGAVVAGGVAAQMLGVGADTATNLAGVVGIGRYGEARDARYQREQKEKMEQLFEANKEMDPLKKKMSEYFAENMIPNLMNQRLLGLSDEANRDFNLGITGQGFTTQMGRQAAQNIIGAGGSTRGARDAAGLALRMERDFDLTNASQLLGKITGVTGSSSAAEKSLAGIMSASMKEGLDKSEFRQENRKFTETVAEIIHKTGAADPFAAALIAERQAKFLADKTPRGMEAGAKASQFLNNLQSQTSGIGSVLEMGAMLKTPGLSKLGPAGLTALSGYSMDDLMAMPDTQKAYLERTTGMSFEDIVNSVGGAKDIKFTGQAPDLYNTVQKARALENQKPTTKAEADVLEDQKRQLEGKGITELGAYFGLKGPEAKSLFEYVRTNPNASFDDIQKRAEEAKKVMDKGKLPGEQRAGDQVISSQATMEGMLLDLEKSFRPQVQGAATDMQNLRTSVKGLTDAYMDAIKNLDSKKAAEVGRQLTQSVTGEASPSPESTQPTAARPSSAAKAAGEY